MINLRRLTVVWLLAMSWPAMATDLLEVYQIAVESDPELRSAEYAYRSAQQALPQARSLNLPQVSASGDFTRSRQEAGGEVDTSEFQTLSLNVRQTLFDLENRARIRQADASIAQAEANFLAAQQGLIFRVADAYFGVLAAQADLAFARQEKLANQEQFKQAERRFEVGLIAITDVREAQASFDLARAREIVAENQVANAREALARITGTFLRNLAMPGDDLPLTPPEPQDIETWVQTARDQNLALIAALYAAEAATEDVAVQRADRYPTVSLVGQHTYTRGNRVFTGFSGGGFGGGGVDEVHDTQVILQFNWDLYTGGRVSSEIRQSVEELERAREDLIFQERETIQQTRDAYRGVISGISQVRSLEQALVSNETALEATEAGFEVGTRTTVDVLIAQRNFFEAERDLRQARYDYILNLLRLKQAAGTLSVVDLQAVNRLLGPIPENMRLDS